MKLYENIENVPVCWWLISELKERTFLNRFEVYNLAFMSGIIIFNIIGMSLSELES